MKRRWSRMAVAGCWVLVFAGGLIAQESPATRPTISPPAQAIAKADSPATKPDEPAATSKPAPPAAKVAKTAIKATLVSNVFVDTDLRQALQDVANQIGVTIVVDSTVGGQVSCELKDATLDKALEILLAGTGYSVKKTPDYHLIYSPEIKSPVFRQVSQGQMIRLNYVEAETVLKLLSPSYRDFVQAVPKGNEVFVTAPEALMARIEADIRQMDKAPGHVMLEARVVVLAQNDLRSLGVKWDWPKIQVGAFSNSDTHGGAAGPSWPWGIQVGYTPGKEFTNSLLLTLNLLSQNEGATVVSSPQIMAQDGKEAQIKISDADNATEVYDESDKFNIKGKIQIDTPNVGGGTWFVGDLNHAISWTPTGKFDNTKIYYAKNTAGSALGQFLSPTLLMTVANGNSGVQV
ncbi:MAG: secretin N-terminal domain-containing protein, partial [Planctomycetota bacterium]